MSCAFSFPISYLFCLFPMCLPLLVLDNQGCSGDERQLADTISTTVSPGREPVKIMEGGEPPEFWNSLGGKTEYASGKWLEEVTPSHPPRLFQCSNASGFFAVEEIFDFAQQVLSSLTVANSTTLVDLHVTSPSPSSLFFSFLCSSLLLPPSLSPFSSIPHLFLLPFSPRTSQRRWPSSVLCSTAPTSLTSWPWESSSRGSSVPVRGRALMSSTGSTLKCCLSRHNRSPPFRFHSSKE